MSRIADADLVNLHDFLQAYRIPTDLGAQQRWQLLKRCHRQVLVALQLWDRFSLSVKSGSGVAHGVPVDSSSDAFSHIGEYFSDLTCVLVCLLHGLYKPANMQLRCAIENFVRGFAGLTSLEAKETKNVYRLFEVAAIQKPFQDESLADFVSLQQIYGNLCSHVHSATPAQRAGVHHVSAHMKHDTVKMREVVVDLEKVNRAALSVMMRADKRLYTTANARVQDLMDELIPKDVRLEALGAKTSS